MEKLKAQYRSLARDSAQAKRKYQEASKGTRPVPIPLCPLQALLAGQGWLEHPPPCVTHGAAWTGWELWGWCRERPAWPQRTGQNSQGSQGEVCGEVCDCPGPLPAWDPLPAPLPLSPSPAGYRGNVLKHRDQQCGSRGCFPWHLPPDKERDKAKEKYVRSLWKLYALHNQYVLAVRAAALHHQHHYQRALPSLHQSLYSLQQEMVLVL